jgi:hypothetical protein
MISKTEIAKLAVNAIVASKTTQITRQQIAAHTKLEENEVTTIVAGVVAAGVVSSKTEPHTDAAVEKIAAWIKTKKEARNNK